MKKHGSGKGIEYLWKGVQEVATVVFSREKGSRPGLLGWSPDVHFTV